MKIIGNRSSVFASIVVVLITVVCFISCPDGDEVEDRSVSSITLFNIPAKIPVDTTKGNGSAGEPADTFSIYLNVSNHMSSGEVGRELLPEAKGYAQFKDATLESNGTYTITVHFMDPNTGYGMPPYNWRDKPWKGTASYFSVSISPKDITKNGLDDVWVRGGLTLNKGKERYDWTKLIDFRKTGTLDYTDQANELYHLIISADKNIDSGTRPYHFGYPHEAADCGPCSTPKYNKETKKTGAVGCQKYVDCIHNKTTHPTYPHGPNYLGEHVGRFPDYADFDYNKYYENGLYKGGYVYTE